MTEHCGSGLITPGRSRSCKHCGPKGGLTRVAEAGSGGTIYAPIIIHSGSSPANDSSPVFISLG
jgi:hypothetical protein